MTIAACMDIWLCASSAMRAMPCDAQLTMSMLPLRGVCAKPMEVSAVMSYMARWKLPYREGSSPSRSLRRARALAHVPATAGGPFARASEGIGKGIRREKLRRVEQCGLCLLQTGFLSLEAAQPSGG